MGITYSKEFIDKVIRQSCNRGLKPTITIYEHENDMSPRSNNNLVNIILHDAIENVPCTYDTKEIKGNLILMALTYNGNLVYNLTYNGIGVVMNKHEVSFYALI